MRRSLTIVTALLLFVSTNGFAQTNGSKDSVEVEKIRSKVRQYADTKKRVVITTRLGEKSKGYITGFDNKGFTLSDPKSSQTKTFQFSDVAKVGKSGGLTTGGIVALAALGAGAAILIGVFGKYCRNEGGC